MCFRSLSAFAASATSPEAFWPVWSVCARAPSGKMPAAANVRDRRHVRNLFFSFTLNSEKNCAGASGAASAETLFVVGARERGGPEKTLRRAFQACEGRRHLKRARGRRFSPG